MTFKMSEVFELPVKKTQGGVLPFLRDSNPMCNTIFVGNDDHVDASVIAINAYDANQELIECLKNQISQLKSENSSMAAYAEQRNNLSKMANKNLSEDNAELKVRIREQLSLLSDISQMCVGEIAMNYKIDAQELGQSIFELTHLNSSELSTKQKEYLQSVKADAVNEFANIYCANCSNEYQSKLDSDATEYCNNLREGKS